MLLRKLYQILQFLFVLPLTLPFFLFMRLFRRWLLIRIMPLYSSRIGHIALNTEVHLCERDAGINVPKECHINLYYHAYKPANKQLALMLGRCLRVWPSWLLRPVFILNSFFPGGLIHEIGENTSYDRDVYNLYERIPPHLSFTAKEELRGKEGLRIMGIPSDAEFICLIARDSAYLNTELPGQWDYHDYRDVDVQNYVLAAEALANLGYYVIRMGAVVKEPIHSSHPKVIDYATNGMRDDFMDVYLGAKCLFCISVGTGFDAIPQVFRRPIAYVNMVPIGYFATFLKNTVGICKKYKLVSEQRFLTFKEIFSRGVGFFGTTSDYQAQGIEVIENTPEEIKSLVIEMLERLKGVWKPEQNDDDLQRRFWKIFPVDAKDGCRPLHGKICARYGAQFLREKQDWLE